MQDVYKDRAHFCCCRN